MIKSVYNNQDSVTNETHLIKNNPQIAQEEMAREIGIGVDGVKYQIKKLREEKVIKREGGRKEGRWIIF